MKELNVFLIGQKAFGARVAEMIHLETRHHLVGAASPARKRKDSQERDPLRARIEDLSLPWIASGSLDPALLPDCDLIVLAHTHVYVTAAIRARARLGVIAYHPSLLPLHRGRDAIRWAVHMRDRVTGGTVYWVDDGIDAGPIAAQEHVFIRPDDDASSLWRRELFPLGVELLRRTLEDVADGTARREPQDVSLATWEPSWRRPPLARQAEV